MSHIFRDTYMIKLIILTIFICFKQTVLCGYQSIFGNNQTSWNVKFEQLPGNYVDSLLYVTDTIIAGIIWKKIDVYTYFNPQPISINGNIFLNEDTTTGRVWHFSSNDTSRILLMDLSLAVGDTFFVYNTSSPGFHKVDSIYFASGLKHVQLDHDIYYSHINEKITFIEGTGPNIGINYPGPTLGFNPYLLCHLKDFQQSYMNPDSLFYDNCNFILLTNLFELKNTKLKLFPNPFTDKIEITNEIIGQNILDVEIFTLQGCKFFASKINSTSFIIWRHQVSDWNDGIYIIKFHTSEGIYIHKVILIS